jgi:hypothetical protein
VFLHVVCIRLLILHLLCIKHQASKQSEQNTVAVFRSSRRSSTLTSGLAIGLPSTSHVFSSPCQCRKLNFKHQTSKRGQAAGIFGYLICDIYPKHSSAVFASVNTDRPMPGLASRPVSPRTPCIGPHHLACIPYQSHKCPLTTRSRPSIRPHMLLSEYLPLLFPT